MTAQSDFDNRLRLAPLRRNRGRSRFALFAKTPSVIVFRFSVTGNVESQALKRALAIIAHVRAVT